MDLHPTPYPGKRRSVANPSNRGIDRTMPSKKPPPQTVNSTQTRPKRAFGVVRSANIPVEKPKSKPVLTKSSKPWKPSGAPSNPANTRRDDSITTGAVKSPHNGSGRSGSGKKVVDGIVRSKKHQRVSFQESNTSATVESKENGIKQEEAIRTPTSSIKTVAAAGTPYLSARDCSKCRLDRLELSTYWLAQIRLAESVGKHFVSAAFFRLALECNAQPFHKIQSELRHYATRHQSNTIKALFEDLFQAYGLQIDLSKFDGTSLENTSASLAEAEEASIFIDELGCDTCQQGVLEFHCGDSLVVEEVHTDKVGSTGIEQDREEQDEVNCEQQKDENFKHDDSETIVLDQPTEEPFEHKDVCEENVVANEKLVLNDPEKSCNSNEISYGGDGGNSVDGKVSEKKFKEKKFTRCINASNKTSSSSRHIEDPSKISGGSNSSGGVGKRIGRCRQTRSKSNEAGKGKSPASGDKIKSEMGQTG
ncbi:uncharacterized protein LOC109724297 [Ananas comosus]|uniref:Uncharacterized protein LOC109724297 n=1 Tax=Ananas comosus TaxID=4615 RepID=A0A6P5GJ27_ANACO|nr:uncharacterized protein LOC109724297 [Ananas comosus]XP_020108662.1 uncharacterized protein LOC109724297 [Ananas comosus]